MFKKLRRKIIITNMIVFGVLILALLGTVYGLAYARMSLEVNEYIEKTLLTVRTIDYSSPETLQTNTLESNSLIVHISLPEKTVEHIVGGMRYDDDFLTDIIEVVLDKSQLNGRISLSDRFLAFNTLYESDEMARIVVYDYTILQKSLDSLLYILLGAFVVAFLSLFVILKVYADKAVRPIEEAFFRQRDLVANASHELKTPLTIIDTSMTILNSYKTESIESNQKWFENISLQSQRMLNLINDMLELAKADNLQNNIVLRQINVSRLLKGALLGMDAAFFESGLNINSKIDEDIIIKGDHECVEKLFYIFIDNAVKYTSANGAINIKLSIERNKAVFRIKNDGSGISKEKLPKLFERFYRVDEAHTQSSSNSFGLGLAIAKSIIDSIGATINIESKEDEYTEFIIAFKTVLPKLKRLDKIINKLKGK